MEHALHSPMPTHLSVSSVSTPRYVSFPPSLSLNKPKTFFFGIPCIADEEGDVSWVVKTLSKRLPGIEPGPPTRQAITLTTEPKHHHQLASHFLVKALPF